MTAEKTTADAARELFIRLTVQLYEARTRGDLDTINGVLSCFAADARRLLLIGAGCLRCMHGTADTEYRTAMMAAISKELYDTFRQEAQQ